MESNSTWKYCIYTRLNIFLFVVLCLHAISPFIIVIFIFYSQYTELDTPRGIHNVHSGVYDAIENLPPGMRF